MYGLGELPRSEISSQILRNDVNLANFKQIDLNHRIVNEDTKLLRYIFKHNTVIRIGRYGFKNYSTYKIMIYEENINFWGLN